MAAAPPPPSTTSHGAWDTQYEWKAVLLMALSFGMVGVDRFMIAPIFPLMAKELNLSYSDIGIIGGALSLAWGLSSFFTGSLSDKLGTKKLIVPSMIIFSILAGVSGLATGLVGLVIIRVLIGISEGAFTPAGFVATIQAAKPTRVGLMMGFEQMALGLFGLLLAPLFVGWLFSMGVHWRWAFALVTVPGIVLALISLKVLREPTKVEASAHATDVKEHKFSEVIKYRNVPLTTIMFLGWLAIEITFAVLLPNYLMDYLHFTVGQMITIMCGFGIGATVGPLIIPAISDFIGRKPVLVGSGIGCLIMVFVLRSCPPSLWTVFFVVMLTCFFSQGLLSLTAMVATESVPFKLMASASGVVIGLGEIIGGGGFPVVAGFVAKHFGIQYMFVVAAVGIILGIIFGLFLKETAPRKVAAMAAALPADSNA